ncbi:ras and EF-hand domain-containing protein [Myripristis murdjan]|uniref:ras and EF-hand domain-containing protein n=1 Tax=Myripristis murdjan TaxID=586833 RepID=UPI0011763234|nr:ras and EF-hand domain-containing protein-like [Myripristis murdjan]
MENNDTSNMDISKAPLTDELDSLGATSQSEDVGNPVVSVQDSDARDGDGNNSLVDDSVGKSQQDDVMNTEMHTSVVSETSICSLNQLLLQMPSSTEDSRNSVSSVRLEEVQAIQDKDINEDEVLTSEETSSVKEGPVGIEKSENSGGAEDEDENALTTTQAPNNMSEGAQVIQIEINKSSQGSRSPNRRRKMGSTRRNLRTRPKEEGLERKQDVDSDVPGTAENVGDAITAESITSIEHKDDETMEGKLDTDADKRSQVTFEAEKESNTAETDMTHTYCISTQSLNQKKNNTGNMDIMKELSVEAPAELLQAEKVQTSLITMYEPNNEVKEEKEHQDTPETTGQAHEQVLSIGAYKIDTTTVVSETSSCSLNQLLLQMPPNIEDCRDSDPNVRSEEVQVIQDKDIEKDKVLKSEETSSVNGAHVEIVKSENSGGAKDDDENALTAVQAPNNMSEGVQVIKIELNKSSQESRSPSRRRKMGSTRRNLRTSPKEDKLQRNAEVENEAPENLEDATTVESVMSIQTKELKLQMEDKDDESNLQLLTPQSLLGIEDRPLIETEHLHSTSATFPEQRLSESKTEGRRRKMGSNRKSKGHQHNKDPAESEDKTTDEEHGRNHQSDTEERAVRTSEDHRAESEVVSTFGRSDKTPSSSDRIFDTGDPSKPVNSLSRKVSERVTPIQHPGPQDHLGQKTERKHSLVVSKESGLTPHYNVVLVGNSNVGKTSFMKRVQSGKFCSDFYASVGIDTCRQPVMIDGKKVMLQLWDTAGQERFHSITRQIFHKAQAFLLMYDITSFQSFSDVRYWISCIQEGAAENVIILLLGNKSDCTKRQVDSYDSEVLAKDYSFEFMECSAATGENVTRSLETVARMLCEKADTKEEGLVLHKEPQQKKSSGCC